MLQCYVLVFAALMAVGTSLAADDGLPSTMSSIPWLGEEGSVKSSDVHVDLAAGVGYLRGDVTYEIGGKVAFADGTSEALHFPISRLEWPLETAIVWADGTVWFGERWCVSGTMSVNVDDGAGRLRDSDWIDVRNPSEVTVYSESEVTLEYGALDGMVQWWCFPRVGTVARGWRASLNAGLLLQHMAWDATDTEQWYPQQPDRAHDFFTDAVSASYTADLCMPYFGSSVQWSGAACAVGAGADLAPWLSFNDEDAHHLRYLLSRTEAEGWAWRVRGAVSYRFCRQWFVRLAVVALRLDADGLQKTTARAGRGQGDRWTIAHEVTASQIGGTCVLGASF